MFQQDVLQTIVAERVVADDDVIQLDRWLAQLRTLRDMGDGEALRFYINRTRQRFPGSAQSHARVLRELEQSAAGLEAIDRDHGRGAALNLHHRTVIQSLSVRGHRYDGAMAENARRYANLQVS